MEEVMILWEKEHGELCYIYLPLDIAAMGICISVWQTIGNPEFI